MGEIRAAKSQPYEFAGLEDRMKVSTFPGMPVVVFIAAGSREVPQGHENDRVVEISPLPVFRSSE